VIPGNDDAIRSCSLVIRAIAEAIEAGKQQVEPREFEAAEAAPSAEQAEAPEPAQAETPEPVETPQPPETPLEHEPMARAESAAETEAAEAEPVPTEAAEGKDATDD
jgi:small subunit ribosomal protein S2